MTGADKSNTDTISGAYCLATRQIGFYRNDASRHATMQVYDGVVGAGGMLTGSFASFAGGDNSGEFPFWARSGGLSNRPFAQCGTSPARKAGHGRGDVAVQLPRHVAALQEMRVEVSTLFLYQQAFDISTPIETGQKPDVRRVQRA